MKLNYARPLVLAILFTLNVASTLPAQDLLPSDAIAIPLAAAIEETASSGGGLYRLSSYEPGVTPPLPPGILSSLSGIADDSGSPMPCPIHPQRLRGLWMIAQW